MIKKWQDKENPKGIRTSKAFAPIKMKAIAQGAQQETVVETTSEKEPGLIQGKYADIYFTTYLTNKQKKQLNKLNYYNTRSKGEHTRVG